MPAIKIICNLTTAPLASDDMVRQFMTDKILLFFLLHFYVALVLHIIIYSPPLCFLRMVLIE